MKACVACAHDDDDDDDIIVIQFKFYVSNFAAKTALKIKTEKM